MVPRTSGHHVQAIPTSSELHSLVHKVYEQSSLFYVVALVLPIPPTSSGFLREKNQLVSFPCDHRNIIMTKVNVLIFTYLIRDVV